ncbi:MAG: phage portal protein [Clostridia bacterium]|nr:phage portal protein [Clostridia bacterium]
MLTYQDFLRCTDGDAKAQFLIRAVEAHTSGALYQTAATAQKYAQGQNPVIESYRKLLYTLSGEAVPDTVSANHKCKSGFFRRFVTQRASYLLGNGVRFTNPRFAERLGEGFDGQLYFAGKAALVDAVSFGFLNADRVEFFRVTEFVPLFDEEDGQLKAGIRFWQLAADKPRRFTLFEPDGYTEYIRGQGRPMTALGPKTPYLRLVESTPAHGERVVGEGNYGALPIVPLYANRERQSTLVGIKEQIDCYDLIKSGFANDLDDASMIYWTLENTGGMDDVDLVQFVERMKTVRAAVVDGDGGARAEAHTMEVPFESREAYLARLKKDLYDDYMALDPAEIAGGQVTATQIRAAYEPLNEAADEFEYCVLEFLQGLMALTGETDTPTFTRSAIVNVQQEVETVLAAAGVLDPAFVKAKILRLLGEDDGGPAD